MRVFRSGFYVASRAFRGMVQTPLVQVLAVATTAVCMLLLGTVILAWANARMVADAWGVDVPVTVYLHDGADVADVDALEQSLRALHDVIEVERVGPELAMERLAAGLGGDASLLEGIEPDILPASIEVRLRRGAPASVAPAIASWLSDVSVVEEVAVAGAWAERAERMLRTLRDLALGIACLVVLACMAIVWSTIRLAIYARRSEIEILRLVGGTVRFVRGPFLVEGCVQGALGAATAMGLLHVAFVQLEPFARDGLSLLLAAGGLRFFTPLEMGLGVSFGAVVGLLGSRAATGRYVET